jgi:hypothetical protein
LQRRLGQWPGNFSQEVIDVKSMKTRIAAGATVVGLGGLAGVALSAGQHQSAATVADKPLVRTKVIRRTIHVTKHAKPKHPAAGGGMGGAAGYGRSSSGSYGSATTGASSSGAPSSSSSYASPVTTSTSGTSSAPASSGSGSAPVVTHTSGAGATGGGGGGAGAPVTTATSGGGAAGGGGGGESDGGHQGHDD